MEMSAFFGRMSGYHYTDLRKVGVAMPDMVYIWISLVIILLLVEIFTLGLTTIWFAGGAVCALLTALLHVHAGIQIAVFVVVSAVLLLVTRPLAVKHLNSHTTKTNAEAFVGKKVRVIQDINNLKNEGQIFVGGLEWTARSNDDTVTFRKDDIVRIVGIEGVKMIVEKVEEE